MSFNLDNYETVEERLIKFWAQYPDGRIETELIEATPTRFIVYSKLYRTEADPKPWTTGLAFETISDRGVNATSALENCETSSIGRCLANAGFATKGKRPSREEMSKAVRDKIIKVEKPSDPWTIEEKAMPVNLDEALTTLNAGIKPESIPHCKHGERELKQGVSKYNKPFYGHVCPSRERSEQCEPIWYVMDKAGRWVLPKPKVEQEMN